VKTTAWGWLALLLIPGCLLVQPLDQARPDDDGSAGESGESGDSGNSSGAPSKAGSGGGTSKAGSGNAGGGGSPNGGAPSGNAGDGGSPSGGMPGGDFSLFTGTWTVTSGESTTLCEGTEPIIEEIEPGGEDEVGLGTASDLIFNPGSSCEILADVDDRYATLNSDTAPCSDTDGTYNYYWTIDAFHFNVSGDGQTAESGMITTVLTTDLDDNPLISCEVQRTWEHER
jgi:hypothetical protein